jgi:transketolase
MLEILTRYHILKMTTQAGSGHPTSCLSAVELMTTLFWDGFLKQDLSDFTNPYNDRLIFSKGHAAPLFYTLYALSGGFDLELLKTLRDSDSPLEGHPTKEFPFTEVPTGSLGQGLSIGVGMALHSQKISGNNYRTFVLLGDSEMSEGSNWEAMQVAAHYKLDTLIGILDVNRLGQTGETMVGTDVQQYARRVRAFGWDSLIVDGHNPDDIKAAYKQAIQNRNGKPKMIIAQTVKGRGVSFFEDAEGRHGKALSQEELQRAVSELGEIDFSAKGKISKPNRQVNNDQSPDVQENVEIKFEVGGEMSTREAYGKAITQLGKVYSQIQVLDAEVSNSTYSEIFQKEFPDRFWEMFIAEQNMVGVGIGLAEREQIPFVSSYGGFLTRAFDQLRMSGLGESNLRVVGSHGGVSIGQDGSSQMGLEDLAMMRSVWGSTVLYPADAVATAKLTELMVKTSGVSYLRLSRPKFKQIYDWNEEFKIGGSKVLRSSVEDVVTIVAAGITVHQALAAAQNLAQEGIRIRVIDLYSLKPVDKETLLQAARETQALITVEDHYLEGGLFSAVSEALAGEKVEIYPLAVTTKPHSGTEADNLRRAGIDAQIIEQKIKEIIAD